MMEQYFLAVQGSILPAQGVQKSKEEVSGVYFKLVEFLKAEGFNPQMQVTLQSVQPLPAPGNPTQKAPDKNELANPKK